MTHHRHRSTLRGVVALVGMMGAAASVPAMGQHPEGYGMQRDMTVQGNRGRETVEVDRDIGSAEWAAIQQDTRRRIDGNVVLCRNVLMTYPSDHLLLTVKSNPAIQIHCGEVRLQMPVVITFESMRGLDWYRTHAGYREIRQGEGPND